MRRRCFKDLKGIGYAQGNLHVFYHCPTNCKTDNINKYFNNHLARNQIIIWVKPFARNGSLLKVN